MIISVMKFSGCAKTTVSWQLVRALGVPFHDADDFHFAANGAKTRSATPLSDEDWHGRLLSSAEGLQRWERTGGALACSALKEPYRVVLQATVPICWVAPNELMARILAQPDEAVFINPSNN